MYRSNPDGGPDANKMAKISTFDDWTDYFRSWQKDIGLDPSQFGDYNFEVKFGTVGSDVIEFGDYAGRPKWETVLQIPDQRVRDSLLHLITYQGDTEFASVEQQRDLLKTAPSEHDLGSAVRIMREEMRHGVQMSYLLVKFFGASGKLEAQKLLDDFDHADVSQHSTLWTVASVRGSAPNPRPQARRTRTTRRARSHRRRRPPPGRHPDAPPCGRRTARTACRASA